MVKLNEETKTQQQRRPANLQRQLGGTVSGHGGTSNVEKGEGDSAPHT